MKILITTLFLCFFFTNKKHDRINDKIKILPDYTSINTIPQMLSHFKNKTVFIDLWATWCVPCVEEFSHSDSLCTFLNDKNIEMLYI